MNGETIRTITIRGKAEGLDKLTADLRQLAAAEQNVAIVSEQAAKSMLSLEQRYQRSTLRMDAQARATSNIARETKLATQYAEQFGKGQEFLDQRIELINRHYAVATTATQKFATQTGLARHELVNLGRQAQDVAVSLAGGQGFGTVMLQQGSQIADVFVSSGKSVGSFFTQAIGWGARFATSTAGVVSGIAAIGVSGAMAGTAFAQSQVEVQRALSGVGRAAQLTATDIGQIAKQSSSVHGLSVKEAEETASVFAATGKMYRENITTATMLTHDFATAIGTDTTAAAKMLAEGLTTGIAGIDKLDAKYQFLTASQRDYLKDLDANVDKTQFQAAAIEMLSSKMVKASELTTTWSQGWTVLGNVVSNVFRSIGELANAPLPTKDMQSLIDQIKQVEQARASLGRAGESMGPRGAAAAADEMKRLNQEFANLNLKLTELEGKQLAAKFGEIGKSAMSLVEAFLPAETKAKALADALRLLEQVRGMPEVGMTMTPEQLQQLDRAIDAKRVDLMMTKEIAAEEARRNTVALQLAQTYGTQNVEVAKVLAALGDQTALAKALAMLRRKQIKNDNIILEPTNIINLKDRRDERRDIPAAA